MVALVEKLIHHYTHSLRKIDRQIGRETHIRLQQIDASRAAFLFPLRFVFPVFLLVAGKSKCLTGKAEDLVRG